MNIEPESFNILSDVPTWAWVLGHVVLALLFAVMAAMWVERRQGSDLRLSERQRRTLPPPRPKNAPEWQKQALPDDRAALHQAIANAYMQPRVERTNAMTSCSWDPMQTLLANQRFYDQVRLAHQGTTSLANQNVRLNNAPIA